MEETRKRLLQEFPVSPVATSRAPTIADPLARIESLMGDLMALENRTHSLLAELVAKLDTVSDHLLQAKALGAGAGAALRPTFRPEPRSGQKSGLESALESSLDHDLKAMAAAGHDPRPAEPAGIRPDAAFLAMPVVVRDARGDYLGMTDDSGKPFTLAQFEANLLVLVAKDQPTDQAREAAAWRAEDQGFILAVTVQGASREHFFHRSLTPRGNTVALLDSLAVAGALAQPGAMQAYLRQVREAGAD